MVIMLIFYTITICIFYKIYELIVERSAKNPPGERTLPFIGNGLLFWKAKSLEDVWNIFTNYISKYESHGIMRAWFGPMFAVIVMDPHLLQVVAESPHAADRGPIYSMMFSEFASGLFTQSGKLGHELKKPFVKLMAKKLINNEYIKTINEISTNFLKYITERRSGQEFDVFYAMGNCFVDIVSDTIFGVKTNECLQPKYNIIYHMKQCLKVAILDTMNVNNKFWIKRHIYGSYTKTSDEVQKHIEVIDILLQHIFDERKKNMNEEKSDPYEVAKYSDFLIKRTMKYNLSINQFKMEIKDVLAAGIETSASLNSTTLLFLAMFPEIQEQAYQEQTSIFGDSSREPTIEDLKSMEFLSRVIKETLRKICPPAIFKVTTENIKLGKYCAPKGTTICIALNKIHNSQKYWQKPDEFFPDHFLPEYVSSRPQYAYSPFGIGNRSCPGFYFGTVSTKILISKVLRTFKLTTSKKFEDIKYELNLLLHIKGGYRIKFEKRT